MLRPLMAKRKSGSGMDLSFETNIISTAYGSDLLLLDVNILEAMQSPFNANILLILFT